MVNTFINEIKEAKFLLTKLVMLVIRSRCHCYSRSLIKMDIFVKISSDWEKGVSSEATADSIITETWKIAGAKDMTVQGTGREILTNSSSYPKGILVSTYVHCDSHRLNICIISITLEDNDGPCKSSCRLFK